MKPPPPGVPILFKWTQILEPSPKIVPKVPGRSFSGDMCAIEYVTVSADPGAVVSAMGSRILNTYFYA